MSEIIPKPFRDGYTAIMVVTIIIVAGGVTIWGDDVKAGRFFLLLGMIVPSVLVLLSSRSHNSQAAQRGERATAALETVAGDVSVVKQQTNGGMIRQVREAQRDQLIEDPEFLKKVSTLMLAQLPCADIAEAAAKRALELDRKSREPEAKTAQADA